MVYLFACWVIFHAFVVVCLLFSKLTFSKNSFRNTFRVSNSLNQDQDRHSDLGPVISKQVKIILYKFQIDRPSKGVISKADLLNLFTEGVLLIIPKETKISRRGGGRVQAFPAGRVLMFIPIETQSTCVFCCCFIFFFFFGGGGGRSLDPLSPHWICP